MVGLLSGRGSRYVQQANFASQSRQLLRAKTFYGRLYRPAPILPCPLVQTKKATIL